MKYKFVINAFDEGSASASTESAPEASGQVTTATGEETQGTTTPETSTEKRPFEDVIKDYKDEYTEKFQKEWNARHKDYMTQRNTIKEQGKLIERLALKYGIEDASDLAKITQAMQADDDLVASRAMNNGLTVDQQRHQDEIELENRRYREAQQETARKEEFQRKYNSWQAESNNLKVTFPNFDFDREMENDDFRNAVWNGMPVERAFYMLHGAEIASGAMQYTAQAVRKATENEIANRTPRPKENGVNRQAAAKVSTDVHNLTKQQRLELAQKSMREKVYI